MTRKEAEKLRGRLQWFETFAHGRIAQQALRVISRIAAVSRKAEELTRFELNVISFLKDRVLAAPPTKIQTCTLDTWIIFTDGACEGEQEKEGSVGAVLVDPSGEICSFFSERGFQPNG